MRRLLADLHAAGVLGLDTLDAWSYDNTDVTKDKVRAVHRSAPCVGQHALHAGMCSCALQAPQLATQLKASMAAGMRPAHGLTAGVPTDGGR